MQQLTLLELPKAVCHWQSNVRNRKEQDEGKGNLENRKYVCHNIDSFLSEVELILNTCSCLHCSTICTMANKGYGCRYGGEGRGGEGT